MGSAVEPPSADLSFAFADRRSVKDLHQQVSIFENRLSIFADANLFYKSAIGECKPKIPSLENKLQGKLQDPWI
jgi:hypothetical protein